MVKVARKKENKLTKIYKAGRKPVRFNRRLIDLTAEEAEKNKYNQQLRLMEYLNDLPIIQLMLDYIEAVVLIVVLMGLAGWFYLEKR